MNVVITVSRQLGSRGSYIAAEVARHLGLRFLDREILQRAAEMAGYPDEEMVQQLERQERAPGVLERVLNVLAGMPMTPTIASASLREGYAYDEQVAMLMMDAELSRDEAYQRIADQMRRAEAGSAYAELVRQVIEEYARLGNVIIVGRGGQFVLKGAPNVLHVRIEAPKEVRVQNLMQRLGIAEKEAERQINQSDRDRARFLKHIYNASWNDPMFYHMVLNTGQLAVETATHLICEAAHQMAADVPV